MVPTVDRIVTGFLAKADCKATAWPYTFEDFDLDGDGYISRDEFDKVRRSILNGLPLPGKAH